MSDKHASEKTPKVNYDEIAGRELDEASNALFDEFSQGARQLFRGGLKLCERVQDNLATEFSFGNEEALERHTKALEREAAKALKRGDISAAKHFIKRDIQFTIGTQGYDDEDSLRLLGEIKKLDQLEKQRQVEVKTEAKAVKPKSVAMSAKLTDLMLTGT